MSPTDERHARRHKLTQPGFSQIIQSLFSRRVPEWCSDLRWHARGGKLREKFDREPHLQCNDGRTVESRGMRRWWLRQHDESFAGRCTTRWRKEGGGVVRDPTQQGKIILRMTIAPDGSVSLC